MLNTEPLKHFLRKPIVGRTIFFAGILGIAAAAIFGQAPDPTAQGGESLTRVGTALLLVGFIGLIIGATAISDNSARKKYASGNKSRRLKELTKNLEEALTAINVIKNEIQSGSQVLENLKKETKFHKELSSLNQRQTAAVEYALQKESQKNIIRDVVLMIIGVILGTAATILLR